MKFLLRAAARTHVGKVREKNEDHFYLPGYCWGDATQPEAAFACSSPDRLFLAAVADGMGGEAAGEVASLLAVRALRPSAANQAEQTAQESIARANREICQEIKTNGGRRMGSTLAALYIDRGRALCCNLGDSRCYLLREGKLEQLSTDHNKAKRMVELGVLTPEQAARHPSRHELTQHLGVFEDEMILSPAFRPVGLLPGDVFLLCSDGLTDMAPEADLAACLGRTASPQEQAEALIRLALEGGGKDNVTAVVVQVEAHSLLRRVFPRREPPSLS